MSFFSHVRRRIEATVRANGGLPGIIMAHSVSTARRMDTPDVPQQVRGDPVRLLRIIFNFLSNALKFTVEGEIQLNVETVTTYNKATGSPCRGSHNKQETTRERTASTTDHNDAVVDETLSRFKLMFHGRASRVGLSCFEPRDSI